MVNVCVADDLDSARDAMRRYIALYVGGMGSRKQNFYNALVSATGSRTPRGGPGPLPGGQEGGGRRRAAGRADRRGHACGSDDVVRERLAVYRDAGVGTLIVAPMAWTLEDRMAQLRHVAELAS